MDRDRERYRTPDAERDTAKAKQKEQGPLSDEVLQQRERARTQATLGEPARVSEGQPLPPVR